MTPFAQFKTLLCFTMITATSLSADAAEIHLRSECRCKSALVTLGDVAEVHESDPAQAKELLGLELFSAPGRTKTLRIQELEELLSLAGVNVSNCQFSGAKAVTIHPAAKTPSTKTATHTNSPGLSKAALQRAGTLVGQAIAVRLKEATDTKAPWDIKLELDESQAQLVLAKGAALSVAGGHEPWTGRQEFVVTASTRGSSTKFEVVAHVSLPPMVVVASRPIRKGEVVRASDVDLQPASSQVQTAVYRLEEVLGKETTRAVATGQVVDAGYVRAPILVQRGEVVRVVAKAAGIKVRTNGRAMQDGSQGDLVEVQPLEGKQRYTARVVNYQEVEVYAQGPSAKNEE